tara:strand:- start:312 stop:863 length:552 start_codon:yes stop_codon:yes gene_type:complete
MKFSRASISDIIICEPEVFEDDRGYFYESFSKKIFEDYLGSKVDFCQENESKSGLGILRGLHFQKEPYAQAKLVRVTNGKVLDVAVDLRSNSTTFGQHISIELSSKNKKQLFIPRGFAHGFLSLEENTIFSYKVDNYYSAEHDSGIIYNDNNLNINWGNYNNPIISKKDLSLPLFKLEKEYFK